MIGIRSRLELASATMVALALCCTSPAAAQEMVVLEPSTNWLLDYADDHCALRRIFGESGQQIRLELRQSMRSDRCEVRVSLSDFSRTPGGLETRFLDGAEFAPRFQIAQFRTGEGGEGFIYHESLMAPDVMLETELSRDAVAAENRARLATVRTYAIGNAFSSDVELQTGPLEEVFRVLGLCVDDFYQSLGIDPAMQANPASGARPVDVADWARPILRTYPENLYREGRTGWVRLQVVVEPDGSASRCVVSEPVVDPEYEEQTCRTVLRRGNFDPAVDHEGNAARSMYELSLYYRGVA